MSKNYKDRGPNSKFFSHLFEPDVLSADKKLMTLYNEHFAPNKIPFKSFILGLVRGNADKLLDHLGGTLGNTEDVSRNTEKLPENTGKQQETFPPKSQPETLGLGGKSFGK